MGSPDHGSSVLVSERSPPRSRPRRRRRRAPPSLSNSPSESLPVCGCEVPSAATTSSSSVALSVSATASSTSDEISSSSNSKTASSTGASSTTAAFGGRPRRGLGAAGPESAMSPRIISMTSAFLALEPGLPPSVEAMVMSSSRSFASSVARWSFSDIGNSFLPDAIVRMRVMDLRKRKCGAGESSTRSNGWSVGRR